MERGRHLAVPGWTVRPAVRAEATLVEALWIHVPTAGALEQTIAVEVLVSSEFKRSLWPAVDRVVIFVVVVVRRSGRGTSGEIPLLIPVPRGVHPVSIRDICEMTEDLSSHSSPWTLSAQQHRQVRTACRPGSPAPQQPAHRHRPVAAAACLRPAEGVLAGPVRLRRPDAVGPADVGTPSVVAAAGRGRRRSGQWAATRVAAPVVAGGMLLG